MQSLNDHESSFVKVLLENKGISNHQRNLTPLIIEDMFITRPNNFARTGDRKIENIQNRAWDYKLSCATFMVTFVRRS